MMPLQMLSGGVTPRESMPLWVQCVMALAPTTHFTELSQAILYRGAGVVGGVVVAGVAAGHWRLCCLLWRWRAFARPSRRWLDAAGQSHLKVRLKPGETAALESLAKRC